MRHPSATTRARTHTHMIAIDSVRGMNDGSTIFLLTVGLLIMSSCGQNRQNELCPRSWCPVHPFRVLLHCAYSSQRRYYCWVSQRECVTMVLLVVVVIVESVLVKFRAISTVFVVFRDIDETALPRRHLI